MFERDHEAGGWAERAFRQPAPNQLDQQALRAGLCGERQVAAVYEVGLQLGARDHAVDQVGEVELRRSRSSFARSRIGLLHHDGGVVFRSGVEVRQVSHPEQRTSGVTFDAHRMHSWTTVSTSSPSSSPSVSHLQQPRGAGRPGRGGEDRCIAIARNVALPRTRKLWSPVSEFRQPTHLSGIAISTSLSLRNHGNISSPWSGFWGGRGTSHHRVLRPAVAARTPAIGARRGTIEAAARDGRCLVPHPSAFAWAVDLQPLPRADQIPASSTVPPCRSTARAIAMIISTFTIGSRSAARACPECPPSACPGRAGPVRAAAAASDRPFCDQSRFLSMRSPRSSSAPRRRRSSRGGSSISGRGAAPDRPVVFLLPVRQLSLKRRSDTLVHVLGLALRLLVIGRLIDDQAQALTNRRRIVLRRSVDAALGLPSPPGDCVKGAAFPFG